MLFENSRKIKEIVAKLLKTYQFISSRAAK